MKTRKEMLEEFVAEDAGDSFSRYALALELEKEGLTSDAVAHLYEVTVRDPDYVAAYYHLGRLLVRQGKPEDARATYQRGLEAAAKAKDQRTLAEIQEAIDSLD